MTSRRRQALARRNAALSHRPLAARVKIADWTKEAGRLEAAHRRLLFVAGVAFVATLGLTFLLGSHALGDDWRQFRGSGSTGTSTSKAPPVEFAGDGKNVAWKVALPGRGLSSPIVIDDRIVVTASSGPRQDNLHVLCFNAASGDLLWERRFVATGRSLTHPKTCNAAPTPASDGEKIFAFFSSNDVLCLDLTGQLLWMRGLTLDYPNASNSLGMSSSPVVAGNVLVTQVENDSESLTTGLNTATGETVWKLDRPKKANWTSPLLMADGQTVLLQSSKGVDAVDARSGETLWSYGEGASTIPSSTREGDTLFIPSNGLVALRPANSSSPPEKLWQENKLRPGTATPVVFQGKVYCLTGAGVLLCADVEKGNILWQLRLEGPFSASPVVAGGKIYCVNESGKCFVVATGGEKGEILSENMLDELILATPSIGDGALYLRSDAHLWKIAAP